MNDCIQSQQLSRYHDGQLMPAERQAFAAHLQHCPACRDELAELVAISRALRSLALPTATDALRNRAAALGQFIEETTLMRLVRRMTAVAAALLVAALLHWAMLRPAAPVVASTQLSEQETALLDPESAGVVPVSDAAPLDAQADPLIQTLAGGRQ